jgi:hypothetical protein
MVILGLIFVLVGLYLWLAPHNLAHPARTIGAILAGLGAVLIGVDLLDLTENSVDDD